MREKDCAASRLARVGLGAVALILAGCWGPPLPAPTLTLAFPVSDTMVSLSWIANSTDHEGFRVYRDGGSGFKEIGTVPAMWVGYQDSSVVTGTFYTYYVVVFNTVFVGGESARSAKMTVEARAPYCNILAPTDSDVWTLDEMRDVTWETNDPILDARITLSLDGGTTFPYVLQSSWTPNGSPWPWKVGYRNTATTASEPVNWEQVVMTTCNQCRIRIYSYEGPAPTTGESAGTFTIQVP